MPKRHTIHSRGFLAQHVGCAQPNAPPTWPALSWLPQHFQSPLRLTSEHFLMLLGCLEFPPSSLPSSKDRQLQGCVFRDTLPCLPVGRMAPSSAPAALCQVLGFAWRWVPLPLAHLARCLWWIPSGCMKLVWMHGLGLAGRPWSERGPCGLCLHHLLPTLLAGHGWWPRQLWAGREFGSRCQEM